MSISDLSPVRLLLMGTAVALAVTVRSVVRLVLSQAATWSGVWRPPGAFSVCTAPWLTAILKVSPAAKVHPLVGVPDGTIVLATDALDAELPILAALVSPGFEYSRGP